MKSKTGLVVLGSLWILLVSASQALATTWTIPNDFSSVQAAVDQASNGDTVLLSDGHYFERIVLASKIIVIASEYATDQDSSHISATILDGDSTVAGWSAQGAVISIDGGTNPSASPRIVGLTIQNGFGNETGAGPGTSGGGVYIASGKPVFEHCVFRSNHVLGSGGAMFVDGAARVQIESCRFENNSAGYFGGAIEAYETEVDISNCRFDNNQVAPGIGVGGAIDLWVSEGTLEDNWFQGNLGGIAGGALAVYAGDPIISSSTFVENEAFFGGGIYNYSGNMEIHSCTFFGNSGFNYGGGIYLENSPAIISQTAIIGSPEGAGLSALFNSTPTISCCNIYGNDGGDWIAPFEDQQNQNGNLWRDPLFCDPLNHDFQIDQGSPLAPGNNSCGLLIGRYGTGCEGILTATVDPSPLGIWFAHTVDSLPVVIKVGNFTSGFSIQDLSLGSIRVNDSLAPDSVVVEQYDPEFIGESVRLYIDAPDLIGSYPTVWDTVLQTYTVTGLFNDKSDLELSGMVWMLGHRSGDVNGDGSVDIADLIALVSYFFSGGEYPADPESADINHDGSLDIVDLQLLVQYMFTSFDDRPGERP